MADLVLDKWPTQPWQKGGASNGNTGYRMPAIPGGTGIVFWLKLDGDPGATFIFDCRDAFGVYWYAAEGGANGAEPVRVKGTPVSLFGFSNIINQGWVKIAVQAPGQAFSQGFTLFCRNSIEQFVTNYQVGGIQVTNRSLSFEELTNPRGLAPADAVAAYYDFSDISNGLLKDVSGHGYHASIVGTPPLLF